jgi:endonuclease/exonuclease/phosphatase family metal-dependent hydrolase
MKCVTLNLRYDNKGDGINKWDNRKEGVFQFMKDEDADIICFQEVLNRQLKDLNAAQDLYAYVGVGRDDGKTRGEYAPIFYKKEKYEKLEDGTFWLSEHPDSVGSVGWDASLPRIATWIILKDKKKDRTFVVINTHFDHIGQKARQQSAELIKRWISEKSAKFPVILTGDLNVTEKSEAYQSLTDEHSPLVDTYKFAKKKKGVDYSFHNFGKKKMTDRSKIDFIFVSPGIKVKQCVIPQEGPANGVYLSDHNPLVSILQMK